MSLQDDAKELLSNAYLEAAVDVFNAITGPDTHFNYNNGNVEMNEGGIKTTYRSYHYSSPAQLVDAISEELKEQFEDKEQETEDAYFDGAVDVLSTFCKENRLNISALNESIVFSAAYMPDHVVKDTCRENTVYEAAKWLESELETQRANS